MSFKQVRKNFIESVKRICHNCGHYNDNDANYCVHCGKKLAKSGDDKQ
ncbi:zinc ribbon domain-containing protein [Acidiplasma cupricumulans]|nr:zinc ribbon domain-containing protein [Acidiplasma cupricumulans]